MKIKKIFRSQKGDAIILLSILVTGIVMLIAVIAVDNLRKSAQLQSLQKQSIDNLYKAEEGIEFGLYANKEKTYSSPTNPPYSISFWGSNSNSNGDQALRDLADTTLNKDAVITSVNVPNQNENSSLTRTVFANLPSRYYDQVPLWDFQGDCVSGGCSTDNNSDMDSTQKAHAYQIVMNMSDFQKSGWTKDSTQYRLNFKCTSDSCRVKNLKVGVGCGDFATCGINCASLMNINFWDGRDDTTGKDILTDWFQYLNGDQSSPDYGKPIDLRNSKVIVQFDLLSGTMEEVTGLSGDIKMCKLNDNGNTWDAFTDRRGGLANVEARKATFVSPYTCCGYEQVCSDVCDQWGDVCVQPELYCCGGYSYSCSNYPSNNSECNSGNVGGGCACVSNGCGGGSYCSSTCVQTCNSMCNCRQFERQCTHSHQECHNGKCNHWCQGNQ